MSLLNGLRQVLRSLRREPIPACATILVLTLGLGPVSILLSLLNAVLFRPWPVRDPGSLGVIEAQRTGDEVRGVISIAEYRYLREHAKTIQATAAWIADRSRIDVKSGQRISVQSAYVNAGYFGVLGGRIVAGRSFVADEEDYNAPKAVAIISERLWRARLGGEPDVVGSNIRIGGQPFLIVGIAARDFSDPRRRTFTTELWMPLPARALRNRSPGNLARFSDPEGESLGLLAGRLAPGATRRLAAAELSVSSCRFRAAASLPCAGIAVTDTRPATAAQPGFVRTVLTDYITLLLAGVLVLGVACANAAGLLLGRVHSRRREIAARLMLGASRRRLMGDVLIEAAVLCVVAGVLAFALACATPRALLALGLTFGARGLERTSAPELVRISFYTPDPLVSWVVAAIVCLAAVVAGLGPALRASRGNLSAVASERHGPTTAEARWRASFLAAQIALTTVLLSGAVVLTRSISRVDSLEPGFRIGDVQTVSIEHPIPPVSDGLERTRAYFLSVRDAIEHTRLGPVAVTEDPPFSDLPLYMMARRPEDAPGQIQQILLRRVSRSYFDAVGIRIVRGRVPSNDVDSQELVVNETAARMLWPRTNPIGQVLLSAVSRTEFERYTVVGVSRDVPVRTMSEIEPVVYRRPDWLAATILLPGATPGDLALVRQIAGQLGPAAKVTERGLADFVRDALTEAALASGVAWVVSALGLILGMVGAFGMFARTVEQRRQEIGIRIALGARAAQVAAVVCRAAGRALAGGLGLGVLLSLLAVPWLRHVLYGLDPFDPVAYLEVAGVLCLAVGLATWLPLRRATSIDPAKTLRAN